MSLASNFWAISAATSTAFEAVAEPSVPTAIVESIGGRALHTGIAVSMPDVEQGAV